MTFQIFIDSFLYVTPIYIINLFALFYGKVVLTQNLITIMKYGINYTYYYFIS